MQEDMKIREIERFGMQRKIVANMTTESWRDIPHAAVVYEPDVTEFWAEWLKLKNLPEWNGITINTVMMYLCTMGFLAAPDMNAHIEYSHVTVTGKITRYDNIDISMPTAMSDGKMMTLNVRNCEKKNLREINDYVLDLRRRMEKTNLDEAMFSVSLENTLNLMKKLRFDSIVLRLLGLIPSRKEIHRLKGKEKKEYDAMPRTERLGKSDIRQGTILISNLGSVYRGAYTPPTIVEIIPPMVCAIALGSFTDKPGIVKKANGEQAIEPRKFLPINLVMDHRALDYDNLVPFCECLDKVFANPSMMKDWLTKLPKAL